MYIPQKNLSNIQELLKKDWIRTVIIYGARRLGKTTLIKKFLEDYKDPYIFANGDDITVQEFLGSQSITKLKDFIGNKKLLVVDEAQRIKNIGYGLKILVDEIPDLKIIATGSSSLDLEKNIGEPLGGRAKTLKIYPLAQIELNNIETNIETASNLENRLIYGTYPIIITNKDNKDRREYLTETVDSYLLKDILEIDGIRNSDQLRKLLRLIAFQIGKEVSFDELSKNLNISKNTVTKYLDLLEKSFVIYSLSGLSRNLRSEITKKRHYYFYDNGIRNALINNFNPLELRDDIGLLWENYIITERVKKQEYNREDLPRRFFWRTYEQQEIDLVEDIEGKLFGYEVKFKKTKVSPPKQWQTAYPEADFDLINKDNYIKFIT